MKYSFYSIKPAKQGLDSVVTLRKPIPIVCSTEIIRKDGKTHVPSIKNVTTISFTRDVWDIIEVVGKTIHINGHLTIVDNKVIICKNK